MNNFEFLNSTNSIDRKDIRHARSHRHRAEDLAHLAYTVRAVGVESPMPRGPWNRLARNSFRNLPAVPAASFFFAFDGYCASKTTILYKMNTSVGLSMQRRPQSALTASKFVPANPLRSCTAPTHIHRVQQTGARAWRTYTVQAHGTAEEIRCGKEGCPCENFPPLTLLPTHFPSHHSEPEIPTLSKIQCRLNTRSRACPRDPWLPQ